VSESPDMGHPELGGSELGYLELGCLEWGLGGLRWIGGCGAGGRFRRR
jgi:hypothetical protein